MVVKLTAKRLVAATAALIMLGMAVAWSGIVNIGASSGHWAVTDWFLHWSMRNTVRTYAALVVPVPAGDPSGLVSAAGHYAGNCAVCHGAPGEPQSPVMQAATPAPPELARTAATWSDRQLFWIIRHGIKFTAMPAWPAQSRVDEVRRMVALVRRLPDMAPAEYRALVAAPAVFGRASTEFEQALSICEGCHASRHAAPDVPVLAGQKPTYLLTTLRSYVSGTRESGVMAAAAARIDPSLWRTLADHYAGLPGLAPVDVGAVSRAATDEQRQAARIVSNGLPEARLPACAKCHGAQKRARYPLLGGQKPEYLAARLRRWRSEEPVVEARQSDLPMPVIARRIPEHMIEPLARHVAELGKQPPLPGG